MPENAPVPNPKSLGIRSIAKNWMVTALFLVALFAAVYFMLWKNFCPNGKDCEVAFTYVREIFGRMLLLGTVIFVLGGWWIYRAYLRRR